MLLEENLSELLSAIMATKVVQSIRRNLVNLSSRQRSIPQSANISYITFPVVVSDDIDRESVMDICKSVEVKTAYDVKKILERDISDTPKDIRYDRIINYLPFNKSKNALDITTLSLLNEDLGEKEFEKHLEMEALDYAQDKIYSVDIKTSNKELISEAHSFIVSERGALPTVIEVEVKYINGKKDIKTATFTFATQAVPRIVKSSDLRLKMSTYDNNRFYKKFIKLTNREEHFVKDFILDYELMKSQAKEAAKDNSIFNEIERRRLLKEMGINKYPFTVFVLSKNLVNKLKESERMDIYKEADKMMDKLMAMAMFIYNPDTDVLDVRFDGESRFTSYPFSEMTSDTSKYEQELKQLVRLNRK